MIRYFLVLMALLAVFGIEPVLADESKPADTHSIPYKTSEPVLEQSGARVGWVVIGLLLAVWGCSYYIKKKNPKIARHLFNRTSKHLKVLDTVRLNPRSHLYVVEFGEKKLLIGQSGDRIATLSESLLEASEQGDISV